MQHIIRETKVILIVPLPLSSRDVWMIHLYFVCSISFEFCRDNGHVHHGSGHVQYCCHSDGHVHYCYACM